MHFEPFDFILVPPERWRCRTLAALGVVLGIAGAYWSLFEAISSREMVEGSCAALFGTRAATHRDSRPSSPAEKADVTDIVRTITSASGRRRLHVRHVLVPGSVAEFGVSRDGGARLGGGKK